MSAQSQILKAFARVDNKIEQQYRKLLKHHDWFSEYSDDHNVWGPIVTGKHIYSPINI